MCALAGAIGSHARPAQTVMIGDSITAAMPAGLCRGALNYGRPSATTRDLLKHTDAILAARPQTIVIMAGVNDIAAGITPDETAANIATTSVYLHARPDRSSGLTLDEGVFLR